MKRLNGYGWTMLAVFVMVALGVLTAAPAWSVSVQPGWPQNTGVLNHSSAALGDLDGDGHLEVVIGAGTWYWYTPGPGYVYAWHADGTPLAGWPQTGLGAVESSPALGDLDGDGHLEVVVGTKAGYVYAWHANGTVLAGWPQFVGDPVDWPPALGDLDGDGDLEVVVTTGFGGDPSIPFEWRPHVYAWHGDGTPVAGWPQATERVVPATPTLGDLDADGDLEVVVACTDHRVYAWHGDGAPVAGWPVSTGWDNCSSPSLGDLDGDGDVEVVVGSWDGYVHAWHHDGTVVAGWPQPAWIGNSSPALGDLDGDGALEVVIGTMNNDVRAWHGDGTPVAGWPQITGIEDVHSSPALGDLDGDGDLEVVIGGDNKVYAWHGDGTPVADWPQSTGGATLWSSPALGDLDGDGDLEVVIGSDDCNIWAWSCNAPTSDLLPWPTLCHDMQRTGLYGAGPTPLVADAGPDKTIPFGCSTILEGSASGGVPPYTYLWSPTTGLSDPNVAQPIASPTSTTIYTLTVTDSLSQTASDSVTVTVVPRVVSAPQLVACPGSAVTVPISVDNATGIVAAQLDLRYDPNILTAVSVEAGDLIAGKPGWQLFSRIDPGRTQAVIYNDQAIPLTAGSGSLIIVTFQVNPVAVAGQSSLLDLRLHMLSDPMGNQLPSLGVNGSVEMIAVHHFAFDPISSPQGGDPEHPLPFAVTIRALDQDGELATQYAGSAELSDLTGTVQTTGTWSDSFEYEDSPLNHGWVLASPDEWPDPYTTTDVAWDGLRSLRCEGYTDAICYQFGDVDAAYVSAWFYDDGDWGYHDEAVVYTRWDSETQFLGLGKYMGPGSVYYVFHNWGGTATSVPVSVGWHHFEWMGDGSTVDLYIDDVHCGSYSGSTLSTVGLGAGEVGMYADKVEVLGGPYVGPFVGGVWTGEVTIGAACEADVLHVEDPSGHAGDSNAFDVIAKGSVNGDQETNVLDVMKTVNIILGNLVPEPWEYWAADMNGDDEVNVQDIILIINKIFDTTPLSQGAPLALGALAQPGGQPVVVGASWGTSASGNPVLAITLDNAAGVAGAQVDVTYNPKRVRDVVARGGGLLAGSDWQVHSADRGGAVRVLAFSGSARGLAAGKGSIVELEFAATGKGNLADIAAVTLTDAAGNAIPVQIGSPKPGGGKGKL